MHAFLIAAIFTGCQPGDSTVDEATLQQAALDLEPQLQTGSLIAGRGDCLAIRAYTASAYTHVGVVVVAGGEAHVYDAMNGVGVRRQPLDEYLQSMSPDVLHIFHPRRPLSEEQGRGLEYYLESQLGREYGVAHHVTGRRAAGVHCAEYATDALMSIDLIHAQRPAKVSPASLIEGMTQHEIYLQTRTIRLLSPTPDAPPADGWCERLWIDTKDCTRRCGRKMSAWFLCR